MFHTSDLKMGTEKLSVAGNSALPGLRPPLSEQVKPILRQKRMMMHHLTTGFFLSLIRDESQRKTLLEELVFRISHEAIFWHFSAEIIIRTCAENAISQNLSPPHLVYPFGG